ncbi:hypothetical protein VE03_05075 [Pseudogymnoascus sp. 23342-1-I1]|nr:hypothetical protein VE03_05075 [Pseudogymnoascus sp. 23342-1-I1]
MVGYDIVSEEVPQGLFYDSVYQARLQKDRNIAHSAASALKASGLHSINGDYLQRLIRDGTSLSRFEVSNTRTIAILGDSGEGKSSLINSILGFPDIAKSGDTGAACTSVVTEYRPKTTNHEAPATMEVEYLSITEAEELLKELLWNFRQMYLPNADDDDVIESEYKKMLRESAEAWSSLEAEFSHQRDFSKDLLIRDMSEEGLAIATGQIIQWLHELDWPADADSGKWTSTADTPDECYEKTSVFMKDQFWPFTKIIRVYIEAQVLKVGIILADLPGLHDTNLARVKATQDYLLRCDLIFVVARISRAITNQSLKSSLLSIVSKHAGLEWEESGGKVMKIAVICTNSEDINEKSARREFCGPNNRISPEIMATLDQDISKEKEYGDRNLLKKLKSRQAAFGIDRCSQYARQRRVTESYSAEIPKGLLEVFCVSNTSYEKYAMKGDVEMVHASGIPDVRQFCYTITSHAHLLEANHFRNSMLPDFLDSALLLATKPTHQIMEDKALEAVSRSKPDFEDRFRKLILAHIEKNFTPLLIQGIDCKIRVIEYQFSQEVDKLVKNIEVICSRASKPNQSSYIVAEMTPAYQSAAQEFGPGMAARQRGIVQGRIENGTLFSNIRMAIRNDIEAEIKESFGAAQKELDNIFVLMVTDIRMGLAMEEQPCEKGDTAREDEEIRKEVLACELRDLKRQHEEVPASIDSIQRGVPQIKDEEESYAF